MQSEQIGKLATALAKAQTEMVGAKKDSVNPFFKSHYADLASVWQACGEALHANGLSVAQGCDFEATTTYVWTRLLHTSGEWIIGRMPLLLGKQDPQAQGAAITYARRYNLAAMVGVIQEDDDAQSAMPTGIRKYPVPQEKGDGLYGQSAIRKCETMDELQTVWLEIFARKSDYEKSLFKTLTMAKDIRKNELKGGE